MNTKNFTKVLKCRLDKKTFNTSKEKDKIFFSQSLSRLNSMIDEDCVEDDVPEHYSNVIINGMEILYLKDIMFKELHANQKKEDSDQIGVLLAVLNHLEGIYLQEMQLLRREDGA